jgi:transcriptional regulator with XRE-family HTH domain
LTNAPEADIKKCVRKWLYANMLTGMSDVATLIREAREEAGLSMRALAERSDVSFTTIYRIENRQLDPKLSTVEKLLSALGQTLGLSRRRTKSVPRLAELADAWSLDASGGEEPDWTRLRAFVDYLFRHPEDAHASILAAPASSGSPLLDNLIAGMAEKIADDNALHRPAWTKRVVALSAPWEGMGTARTRAAARAMTPPQFASRNVFVPAESIWRVRDRVPAA